MPRPIAPLVITALLLTAGCLSAGAGPTPTVTPAPTGDTSGPTASTPDAWGTASFPEWDPAGPAFRNLTVGASTGDDPEAHTYTIWNHDDDARRIRLTVVRNGTVVVNRTDRFPTDGTLSLGLAEAADYRLTIAVPAENARRTLTDPVDDFDCNAKGTNVAVLEGGAIRTRSFSTLLACESPTEA